MTLTATRPTSRRALVAPEPLFGLPARIAMVGCISLSVVMLALVLPAWPPGEDMGSTHYMGLLAANQPWNLLLFMAVPVVLAETIAVTELIVLFSQGAYRRVNLVNRYAGMIAGVYFLGVFAYLLRHAVVPLTRDGGWRGTADVVAVGFYLLGLIPLYGMTLLETRIVGGTLTAHDRRKLHAALVGAFLVVAHVAMIFGMLDPTVLGWSATHVMPGGTVMPGMTH